jgi:hypothetical protein
MQEVEAICDRVIIIDHGKIVTDKKLDKLVSEEKEQIIEVEFDKTIEETLLAGLPNIKTYKNFSKYDNFIVDHHSVQIQIDQNSNYDVVSTYYSKIYNRLFQLIDSTEGLKDCIINYVTSTQTLEIVDANVKTTSTLKNFDFVNSNLEGIFEDCLFLGCEIKNSQCIKSKLLQSEAEESKILNCKVDQSTLKNCFFMNGHLNGDMHGGVFRSGKLGPFATMDSDVKVITDNNNFFDTKYDEETKGDKKGVIDGYGKSFGKK